MKQNTISVIIPVYNVKAYVKDCLDSIVNQTTPFDEIIIVNDGSADGSEIICREYRDAHPGIILIEQENMGLSEARNNGIKKATGDYIIFVDSDDWVSEGLCETVKRALSLYDVDVVHYASKIIKEIQAKISREAYARKEMYANTAMDSFASMKELFPAHYQMSACMAAYRRLFLQRNKIGFIKDILYEDRFFSLRVITEAESVVYITDKLYVRRLRKSSICTSQASRKKVLDVLYGHRREWEYIRNSEKWKREKSLTQYYALCGAVMAYQEDVSSKETREQREEYLMAFFGEWLDYFAVDSMGVNELCELLLMVRRAAESRRRELLVLFETYEGIEHYQERIRNILLGKCREKLWGIPFGEKKRIGIYGAGVHTESLFRLYRNLIGEIAADITLIVSNENDIDPDNGIIMETLNEVSDNRDIYLISSKVYQEEMYQSLRERMIPEQKIIRLYGRHDAVDCVMLGKALFD